MARGDTITILIVSTKMSTLDLIQIKVLIKVITFFYDVTNKILSRDSNYTVDVVILPKFGSSSISMREVIITWIL